MSIPFTLLKTVLGIVCLAIACVSATAADSRLTVGIQTWTLRNMEFDQVVRFALDHKVSHLQMISKHIDPMGPMDEIRRKKGILDEHGLTCYTFGVAATFPEKEKNRKLFDFARFMGCRVIVVEPKDFQILDSLEELAVEYNIRVAIHNHGIHSLYGNPLVVQNLIRHRDPRIGVCLDTGWITSAGLDAAKVFREYDGRVYDIHLKDKVIEKTQGADVYLDVEVGTGQANFKGLFKALKETGWKGILAIETDNRQFAESPDQCVKAALKFVADNQP